MKTLAALCAALLLGGCYNPRYPSETPGSDRPVRHSASSASTASSVYRTGPGTVELVEASPSPSAAVGGTRPRNDEVTLRMDDGTRQVILLPAASGLQTGDRVEVTSDRSIERR